MNRRERITQAKEKVAKLKPYYDQYMAAQNELQEAYYSFDAGEHVFVGNSDTYGPGGPGQVVEISSKDKILKVKLDTGETVVVPLYEVKRA